jgi:2-polyprenyl-6-methoxyphenol hydroxylase-like FAD-dependent oxidoreductase
MPVLDRRLGKHAIVVGGSIGGLLSARVLSDYFERVSVVERDVIPPEPEARKNVPQGRHVHALFGGGVRVVERLFPRFFDELVAAGAVRTDFARDLCWYHQAVWKLRTESGLVSYWQTRPFLEHHLRRRTRAIPNVEFLEQCEVTRLVSDESKVRIVGVEIEDRKAGGASTRHECDLVVHAGGRGGRVVEWLKQLGYDAPAEQTVDVHIGYASRFFERPPDDRRDWHVLATFATPPNGTRSGYLFPVEGGRWLATVVGFAADYPPADEKGYVDFAQSLELPDFFEAIKDACPLSPVATYHFPAHRWHRYDKLARMPKGLIALGDAVCSFNPVYGQGMSACALQVDLLDRCLSKASESQPFERDFHRAAAKIIAVPWLLATTSDFLFAGTKGPQGIKTRLLKRYVARVFKLCATNRNVLIRFYRVLHFLEKPAVLFRPSVLFPVLKSYLGLGGIRSSKNRPPRPEM